MRKGKGREAKLSFLANTLMENRNGLIVGVDVRHATGTGERDGAPWSASCFAVTSPMHSAPNDGTATISPTGMPD